MPRGKKKNKDKGDASSSGETSAAAEFRAELIPPSNGHAERRFRFPSCFYHPLSDQATIVFLKKAADTSVMGLVTLCSFYATFLLAWGKACSICIPYPKDSTHLGWVQILVASLPFVVFPATLFVSGMVEAAAKSERSLGVLATLCLIEFIAAIALGGGMWVCMSGSGWILCLSAFVVVLMILAWGLAFRYPKFLRKFIWSTCFRQVEIAAPTNEPRDSGQDDLGIVVQ